MLFLIGKDQGHCLMFVLAEQGKARRARDVEPNGTGPLSGVHFYSCYS